MYGHGERLTRKQHVIISALLTEPTHREAAQKAGISPATLTRWFHDAGFVAAYQAAKDQALGETLTYLQQSLLGAVAVLRAVMTDETSKPPTRVQAARALLELGLRAHQMATIEGKMDLLLREVEALRHAGV
jgi:hypothetical protein